MQRAAGTICDPEGCGDTFLQFRFTYGPDGAISKMTGTSITTAVRLANTQIFEYSESIVQFLWFLNKSYFI
jgi:hypothetical protein